MQPAPASRLPANEYSSFDWPKPSPSPRIVYPTVDVPTPVSVTTGEFDDFEWPESSEVTAARNLAARALHQGPAQSAGSVVKVCLHKRQPHPHTHAFACTNTLLFILFFLSSLSVSYRGLGQTLRVSNADKKVLTRKQTPSCATMHPRFCVSPVPAMPFKCLSQSSSKRVVPLSQRHRPVQRPPQTNMYQVTSLRSLPKICVCCTRSLCATQRRRMNLS